jgi:hypothetical protein
VELDLATVNEMADRDAVAHLVAAADGLNLPDDRIPDGAPLALWFFLHRTDLFHEVFLQHQIREVAAWRQGHAPAGVPVEHPEGSATLLAERLKQFFRLREGTGRFCAVDVYLLRDAVCFLAQVADRLRFVDSFTDAGEPKAQKVRPAIPVLFVYYPKDGRVLLKSHVRAPDRVSELLEHFGQAVLGCSLTHPRALFNLDRLKRPFHPLPDGPDMEGVRVKSLHLRYPQRSGRRQVKLETAAGDAPDAIDHLLRTHVEAGGVLDRLTVCHAELQVRLRVNGRSKPYLIRLWPDRCSLNQTPVAERLRECLRRWGLSHAG